MTEDLMTQIAEIITDMRRIEYDINDPMRHCKGSAKRLAANILSDAAKQARDALDVVNEIGYEQILPHRVGPATEVHHDMDAVEKGLRQGWRGGCEHPCAHTSGSEQEPYDASYGEPEGNKANEDAGPRVEVGHSCFIEKPAVPAPRKMYAIACCDIAPAPEPVPAHEPRNVITSPDTEVVSVTGPGAMNPVEIPMSKPEFSSTM